MASSLHIDKVYYWDLDAGDVAVSFNVVDSDGAVLDCFESYTKAERRIVEILERESSDKAL